MSNEFWDGRVADAHWINANEFTIGGRHIRIDQLKLAVAKEFKLTQFLLKRVLRGVDARLLMPPQRVLQDNLEDVSLGYGFISDDRNGLAARSNEFSNKLVSSEQWGGVLASLVDGKTLEWDTTAIKEWFEDTRRLKQSIFVSSFMSNPLPGYPDSFEMRFCNSVRRRNLFSINGNLCLLVKVKQVGEPMRVVPCLLPTQLEEPILVYLTLIRPLEQALAKLFLSSNDAAAFHSSMWVGLEGVWSKAYLENVFTKKFEAHTGITVSLDQWRDISFAMSRRHVGLWLRGQPDLKELVDKSVSSHFQMDPYLPYLDVNVGLSVEADHTLLVSQNHETLSIYINSQFSKMYQSFLGIRPSLEVNEAGSSGIAEEVVQKLTPILRKMVHEAVGGSDSQ